MAHNVAHWLLQAEPLVAQRGSTDVPEQHCSLSFPPDLGTGGSGDSGSPVVSACTACGTFDARQYMAALNTQVLGRLLLTAATTASTQVVVQENVAKLPDGLVFLTDKQLGGKGACRQAARWQGCEQHLQGGPPAAAATMQLSDSCALASSCLQAAYQLLSLVSLCPIIWRQPFPLLFLHCCLAGPRCWLTLLLLAAAAAAAGRGGNRWDSPDGCLMFSACTRLAIPGQRLPFVQYVVSLAVVQAVQAEAAQQLQVGEG